MGIFTRFRDIISSNINAMLDGAEDPEKLARLMIQEMEDTLVELKSSCARTMADSKKALRSTEELERRRDDWERKAKLAVEKSREDLAREALVMKRQYSEKADVLRTESDELSALVKQYQEDIKALEEKLKSAREKHRVLVQRQIHATKKKKAATNIRRYDSKEPMLRFDEFEHRIDRLEAEADLVNTSRGTTVQDEFSRLEVDDDIEKELAELKAKNGSGHG